MQSTSQIFERIQKLTHEDGQTEFGLVLMKSIYEPNKNETNYNLVSSFLHKIFSEIDTLANEITIDETILISVRNQKLLRTCYQLVTCLGISSCLIPGVGINMKRRSATISMLPPQKFTDEQKYELLVKCIDFFTKSYKIPVLKNIIITLHLSDYLAGLIQLAFAPIKKPGNYNNFIMTQEMFVKLIIDREEFLKIYENLVMNCFQPIIMKELLVLQSVTDPQPPAFVRKVITRELSRRLLTPGGLLSLIRCFIESYNIDVGLEWKKIDMISRIVTAKHGNDSEEIYLQNICSQLQQVLALNNTHYLTTAVVCVLNLKEKYPNHGSVHNLYNGIFKTFDYTSLEIKATMPGTILLTAQEVDHGVNVLHACSSITQIKLPAHLIQPNLQTLFIFGMKSSKNNDFNQKIRDILVKFLEKLNDNEILNVIKTFLFGKRVTKISIVEYEVGLAIKSVNVTEEDYSNEIALSYFLEIFKNISKTSLIQVIFETALLLLNDLGSKRTENDNVETLLGEGDEALIITETDKQYAIILQLLSEISSLSKVVSLLRNNPLIILNFTENTILKSTEQQNECTTIALVLLNTVLANTNKKKYLEKSLGTLLPVLRKMSNENSMNSILCKEALSLISSEKPEEASHCAAAVTEMFDNLLPVRAHGVIQITKLINAQDPETISKKHYIFCLLQEQLKDADSYVYLASINGIAALGVHCTEDVLQFLCKEFLDVTMKQRYADTNDSQNNIAEMRMKIGDIIVKVTKGLGEMAIVYKNLLLNTVLCGCRDEDPLIRTSALSNLAEIALVLHYKIGTIIYEVLLCVWGIIETDKAIECRRAAVMVISNLLKGLGKDTLIQLKDNLMPVYRTLKSLYSDTNEDETVRLHAQIALEELNSIVQDFLFPEISLEKQIFVLDQTEHIFK